MKEKLIEPFTEADYVQSEEYRIWPKGHNGHLPEDERHLLGFALLRGSLLWHGYMPIERDKWEEFPEAIRTAEFEQQVQILREQNLLVKLPVIIIINH